MQFCPLLLNVCVESLSFKKPEEGLQGPLCSSLDLQLQYRKFLASRDFGYSKVSKRFLLFISIEEDQQDKKDRY